MNFYIAVFKSRTDATALNGELRRMGINSKLISTPERVNAGCGLSVKFYGDEYAVLNVIRRLRLSGFVGFTSAYGY